jgi:hypothetical protein
MHQYKSYAVYMARLLHPLDLFIQCNYEACFSVGSTLCLFWFYFGCDTGMVLATEVICTNINLVHPIWLTKTILGICLCMRLMILMMIIIWQYVMRKCAHKTLSYVHAYWLHIWFDLVGTLFSSCVFIWGIFCICYVSWLYLCLFGYVLLQTRMIKLLWNYNFLNFGSDQGIVLLSQVICTKYKSCASYLDL